MAWNQPFSRGLLSSDPADLPLLSQAEFFQLFGDTDISEIDHDVVELTRQPFSLGLFGRSDPQPPEPTAISDDSQLSASFSSCLNVSEPRLPLSSSDLLRDDFPLTDFPFALAQPAADPWPTVAAAPPPPMPPPAITTTTSYSASSSSSSSGGGGRIADDVRPVRRDSEAAAVRLLASVEAAHVDVLGGQEQTDRQLSELSQQCTAVQRQTEQLLRMQGELLTRLAGGEARAAGSDELAVQRRRVDSTAGGVERLLGQLRAVYATRVLTLEQQRLHQSLASALHVHGKQLQLLAIELRAFVAPPPTTPGHDASTLPPAALVVVQQPFPGVFAKRDALPADQLQVRLLTASTATQLLDAAVTVRARLDVDQTATAAAGTAASAMQSVPGGQRGSADKPLDNDAQCLDVQRSAVVGFPLVFASGTRKDCAALTFSADVQFRRLHASSSPSSSTLRGRAHIESEASQPFVVMTNQKQWDACEGLLLKAVAFCGALEIPWLRFANALGRQFIGYAKTRAAFCPYRPLSSYDYDYLKARWADGSERFSVKAFEDFWSWFGPCCHSLKYQRHLSALWHKGYVYGFVSRDDVVAALRDQPPGTILVRFSERHAGLFGISHVSCDGIKHYLVQPTDISAKVGLADFIRHQSQWTALLQYVVDSAMRPGFVRVPKHAALEPFYTKGATQDLGGSGYDPL